MTTFCYVDADVGQDTTGDWGGPIRGNHWISTDPRSFHSALICSALSSQEITTMDTRILTSDAPATSELNRIIAATDILLDDALPEGLAQLLAGRALTA